MQVSSHSQIDLQFVHQLISQRVRGGQSLRRRRVWFVDETSAPTTSTTTTDTSSTVTPPATDQPSDKATPAEAQNAEKPKPDPVPYDRFQEAIKAKNEAQAELKRLQSEADARAKAELERQRQEEEQKGEFKSLYEKEKEQRTTAETKLADLQRQIEELTAYRSHFEDGLKAQMEALPPHIVVLLEKMTPLEKAAYLKENGDMLTTRRAPNLDAGERHTGSGRRPIAPNPIGGF
jgi:glutaredoxin